MKKIFMVPLLAILMAIPMIAGAVPVAGEPVAGDANSPTATSAPKYALKYASASDEYAATAGYVKGAYNALVKGINKTQEEINTLNTGIGTYADSVNHLLDNTATQTGTVATIKNATTTEQISSSSVNMTGVETTSLSATASGTVTLGLHAMDNWETDSQATNDIAVTTNFSEINVNGMTMSAPTTNTATLTKSGIGGTVTVAEYVTQAINAGTFDFTQLINVNGDGFEYMSADGQKTENADGLSNGEWTTTWNDYGTVKGTSKCSVTGEGSGANGTTGNPSDTAGKACWCKMTGFTDKDGNEVPATSLWVYISTRSSASACTANCARNCGNNVRDNSARRSTMFGSMQ